MHYNTFVNKHIKNYYKKIGYSDKVGGDWWLRSPDGTGGDPSLALFCAETGSVKAIASKNEKYFHFI